MSRPERALHPDQSALHRFGYELRRWRKLRGLSQSRLGEHAHVSGALIQRIEVGERSPSHDLARRCDAALDADGAILDAWAGIEAEVQKAASNSDTWHVINDNRPSGLAVSRVFGEAGRCRESRPPANADYLHDLWQATGQIVTMDTRYGGDDLVAIATRMFRSAHSVLASGAYLPEVERDLQATVGAAGEVAAWIAYDADQQPQSRLLCHEAMLASRMAGDRGMEVFELTHLAMQSVHLHRSAEALRVADDLLDGPALAGRVAAVALLRRGRALAQLGDRPRALAAIGKAGSLIADGPGGRDPEWTWWLDEAEFTWHRGMANAELGDWGAAVGLFHGSSAGRDPAGRARSRYNDAAHLLNALVHVRAWAEAEPVARELIGLAAEVGSARIANFLLRITQRIKSADTTTTLADTAEELARLLHSEATR